MIMEKMTDVVMSDSFDGLGQDMLGGCLAHAYCEEGTCSFSFNGRSFVLRKGDLMIVRKGNLIEDLEVSDDFRVKVLYATPQFIEQCTPQTNYGMKGSVALFNNPVMHLSEEQRSVCQRDFRWIEYRLGQTEHNFYTELLRNAVQSAILDFFDFHSRLYGEEPVSAQNAAIMDKFIAMLENGDYRSNREVAYYADAICVTPKYLSEASKKVSGFAANYWINRYTILDIKRHLADKSLTLANIADMFNFSSQAYFSRYVQRYLGMNPTDCRE